MKPILVFDVETSGFPLWKEPSDHPSQPHLVQVAAVMVDADTRKVIQSLDLIARPDGWDIPDDVAKIHGITTEQARAVGVNEGAIVSAIWGLWSQTDCMVGHNIAFDRRMMRIALKRFMGDAEADTWKAGVSECTMRMATPIVKCPPSAKMLAAGRKHHKSASLSEAHEHFFGEKFENAHSAMADVLATMRVYWAIKDMEDRALTKRLSEPTEATPEGSGGDGVGFL